MVKFYENSLRQKVSAEFSGVVDRFERYDGMTMCWLPCVGHQACKKHTVLKFDI